MDYTRWPEIHPQPPNPNPRPTGPYPPPYSSFHYPYDPSNPNPIYLTAPPPSSLERNDLYRGLGLDLDRGLRRLGVDSYTSLRSYPDVHLGSEGHTLAGPYVRDHRTVDTGSYEYYSDPMSPNWGVNFKENIRQYGADPGGYGAGASIPSYGTEQIGIANPNFTFWANSAGRPPGNSTWKNHSKKMRTKSKIVQSAHCEVCKINCDTKRVLDKHKLGKKHKKNLEKLTSAQSAAESNNPAIGPQEPPDIGDTGKAVDWQKTWKKAVETVEEEDLETKRRKVLKGGAAAEAVRTCAMCNVVCNSGTVFNSHLAGQKHADMMKKHAAGTGMATAS